MYCGNCGHENDNQARFCAGCGTALSPVTEQAINGEQSATAVQYASFLRRFAAAVIDTIVVYAVLYSLYFALIAVLGVIASTFFEDMSEGTGWTIVIYGAIGIFILGFAYFPVMEGSSKQATLGKTALGIIVTDREGNRMSLKRAALRNLVKIISAAGYGVLLVISCFTILFTPKKQALHDMVSRCHVVMKRA